MTARQLYEADGRRVWPPSLTPIDPNTEPVCFSTEWPMEQPHPEPIRLNRHERRRARKMLGRCER